MTIEGKRTHTKPVISSYTVKTSSQYKRRLTCICFSALLCIKSINLLLLLVKDQFYFTNVVAQERKYQITATITEDITLHDSHTVKTFLKRISYNRTI